jgi:hypothetical protein
VLFRRAMRCVGQHRLHQPLRCPWPVRHQPIAQRAVVVAQMNRSIQTLVDHHRLSFAAVFHQVDLAFMLDGGIGIESTWGFQAQHSIQIQPLRHPTMQIGGLRRWDPEALVVDRQIASRTWLASDRVEALASRSSLTRRSCSV